MTRIFFLCLSILRVAAILPPHESGPTLDFFNYSGMQATISCVDHPAKRLEAGGTFSIPLSRSDQACLVTLKDGEHASATLDKVLPLGSASSGHSVSVDINDTFLFFALDETPHHQYINFHQQLQAERASDLLLWSMDNASDE